MNESLQFAHIKIKILGLTSFDLIVDYLQFTLVGCVFSTLSSTPESRYTRRSSGTTVRCGSGI